MIFTETSLPGVYLIAIEKREDGRGFFARAWCTQEFAGRGLVSQMVQCNLSSNKRRGTLRSLHYQIAPYQETKLVRCIKGAIFDVIVDVRPDSPTYGRWLGVELTAEHYTMLYVPQHCAHGFLTLQDNTEVMYQVSQFYAPECERGVRYDDPAFGITWPLAVEVLLEAGVVLTNADGDQPGVLMNLYRFGQGIGVEPVLCGNIKGLHDPYRNPTTQAAFARQLQQNPRM